MSEPTRDASTVTALRLPGSVAGPDEPPLLPVPPTLPGNLTERYHLLGEIGRGGMGAVLHGHDPTLGRDLAIKVLLPHYAGRPDIARRFRKEAQVSGQLQHPGVVPVYELGALADGQPYFTMKLVKGVTLASLLRQRRDPGQDRPRFLKIFEQVCQAVAYAHSMGVIHRDLKPDNIMVGSFGEVQVMDWGLAKILASGGHASVGQIANPSGVEEDGLAICPTEACPPLASGSTQAGDVMGTLAYMPPEQASGAIDRLDERSDVFSLGAILCEILTGQPPYVGGDSQELLRQAQRPELADALTRLDACGADSELTGLARRCLAAEPAERPWHAGEVAEAVAAYQQAVSDRLRQAEIERAAAETRAAEERKRRRLTLALASSVLLLVAGAGVAALWYQRDRADRAADLARRQSETQTAVTSALDRATQLIEDTNKLHDDPYDWEARLVAAKAAVGRAEDALKSGTATEKLRDRVGAIRTTLEEAERDRLMVARLDEVSLEEAVVKNEAFDAARLGPLYAQAFREYGIDVESLEPEDAARRIRGRAIRDKLLAALDTWRPATRGTARRRLAQVARAADPEPEGVQSALRRAFERHDRAAMRKLAADIRDRKLSAATLRHLAGGLFAAGDLPEAVRVLRQAHELRPQDFWITHNLGLYLSAMNPKNRLAAVGYLIAAATMRPRSPGVWVNLGAALHEQGLLDRAAAAYEKAVALKPDYATAHTNLANVLRKQKKLARAVRHYRLALTHRPDYLSAYFNLAAALADQGEREAAVREYEQVLMKTADRKEHARAHYGIGCMRADQGRLPEAITALRQALSINPRYAAALSNLGGALDRLKQTQEALEAYQEAVRLQPDALNRTNLGIMFRRLKDLPRAAAEFEKALQVQPNNTTTLLVLGRTRLEQGRFLEAVIAFRRCIDLGEARADLHYDLGLALLRLGQLDAAAASFQQALALKGDHALAAFYLGVVRKEQKQLPAAIEAFRKATRVAPKLFEAHYNLGQVLLELERPAEAADAFRRAADLARSPAESHYNLGRALLRQNKPAEATAAFRKALALRDNHSPSLFQLGLALAYQKKLAEAAEVFQKVTEIDPRNEPAFVNLGKALADLGRLAESEAANRQAARLRPGYAAAYQGLGYALLNQNRPAEAADAYKELVHLWPQDAMAHCMLGHALVRKGAFAEGAAALRHGHTLGAAQPGWRYPSAQRLREAERFAELDARLGAVLRGAGKRPSAVEQLALASFCRQHKGFHAAAAHLYAAAFAAEPQLAADRAAAHRYQAGCSAARAAAGPGELDARERALLRSQALEWLRTDLNASTHLAEKADNHPLVRRVLMHWLKDEDLASVREAKPLAALPEAERKEWRKLWADVAALRKKVEAKQ